MTYTIKLRRGLASDWTAVNPTLAEGELGYELDTRYFKVGDGVTAWNALPYTVDEDQYLPDASLEDDGKILLTFAGGWVVAEPPSGLPDPTDLPDGKMLATVSEEWVVVDSPTSPEGGGAFSFVVPAYIEGEIATIVGDQRFYNPAGVDLVIQMVSVGQSVGPSGGPNIYDLNVNGITVFTDQSHRPTVAIDGHQAVVGAIDAPAWPANGYISWDVDLIGTTSPGSLATLTVLAVPA